MRALEGRRAGANDEAPSGRRRVPWVGVALLIYVVLTAIVWLTGSNWLVIFAASVAIVWIVSAGIGDVVAGRGLGLLVDDRRMISLSRFQMVLWTGLVLGALLAAFLGNIRYDEGSKNVDETAREGPLDITLPTELLILMGIASTSLVGSPAIRTLRRSQSSTANPRPPAGPSDAAPSGGAMGLRGSEVVNFKTKQARFTDMFRGEEGANYTLPDIGKIQNFIITLIVALAYTLELGQRFYASTAVDAFPPIDQTIITLVGISHAGYLTLKAVPQGARGPGASTVPAAARAAEKGAAAERRAAAEPFHPGTEPTE